MGECLTFDPAAIDDCVAEKRCEALVLLIGAATLLSIAALIERKRPFTGSALLLAAPFALGAVVLAGIPWLWHVLGARG
jgi:hypothetical protein